MIEEPSARMVMGCRRCILCSRGRKRAASPLSPLLGEVSNRSGAAGRQASRSRSCSGGGGLYSCGIAAGRDDSHRRSCSRASVHRFVLAVVPRRTSAQLGTPTAILYGRSAPVPRSSATRALGARHTRFASSSSCGRCCCSSPTATACASQSPSTPLGSFQRDAPCVFKSGTRLCAISSKTVCWHLR